MMDSSYVRESLRLLDLKFLYVVMLKHKGQVEYTERSDNKYKVHIKHNYYYADELIKEVILKPRIK